MKIPPGPLGLIIGVCIGALLMFQYIDRYQMKADDKQIKKDNVVAEDIQKETTELKEKNEVVKVTTIYRNKEVKVPRDLTNEEISILCSNTLVPNDIVQSIRSEASRTWERINKM